MSRHAITSLYETAIVSRPHTQQLLINEISNSPSNVKYFDKVYSPWFVLGPSENSHWRWSWPRGQGTEVVPEYTALFKEKDYPSPRLLGTQGPGGSVKDFNYTLLYSLPIPVSQAADVKKQEYDLLIENLCETYKEKYELLVNAVKGSSLWVIETARIARDTYKVRYKLSDMAIHLILVIFMYKQKTMPQKDIFKYGSVLKLLHALNSIVSNRQKKSTAGAAIKKEIPGLIYQDDNVIVVEPPTWQFSRRYFGAPKRRSLLDDAKIIDGAQWCTAASDYDHWHKFVDNYKNHLYYFVNKKTDELHAIRTAGGGDVSTGNLYQIYNRMAYSVFSTAHSAELMTRARDKQLVKLTEVINFNKKLTSGYLTKFDVDIPGLMQAVSDFKDDDYQAYTEYFTHEARNQQNEKITMQSIFDKYGLDINWVKKHLKFVDYLD